MPKDLYDEIFTEIEPAPTAAKRLVPNVLPRVHGLPYRIAIVGEAPGADEEQQGIPFIGYSGRELDKYLSKANIVRDACLVGNICQVRPFKNQIAQFEWDGPEIQKGLEVLTGELAAWRPNLVLCLGGAALHAFKCGRYNKPPKFKGKEGPQFKFPNPIGDWRGSLFEAHMDSPCPGVKCISTYHPAAALRNYEWMPLIMLDILYKVCNEATSPILSLPQRNLEVDLGFEEILQRLHDVSAKRCKIAIDIEGRVDTMSCISVAPSATHAFIVPFTKKDGSSLWSHDEEVRLWRALSDVLEAPNIPKVLQNSLYDRFVLQYSYNIVVRGVVDDTMLKHHELYSELEKSLGFLCSLYTKEPFYKSDRKSDDLRTFWQYCCRDSATTFEINEVLDKYLKGDSLRHYRFNMVLLNPLLGMELRGILYDQKKAAAYLKDVSHHVYTIQHDLDAASGHLQPRTRAEWIETLRDVMCWKKDRNRPKSGYEEAYDLNMRVLLGPAPLTKAEIGRLNTDCDFGLNIKSPKFKKYLYETLKLPAQYDKKTKALTADYEALLRVQEAQPHPVVDLALQLGTLRTRAQMLAIHADKDGRIRCGYNLVGTETCRITCYTSPTGSGYNLQTIPDENHLKPLHHPLRSGMRDLFVADPGYYLFQCDLSGADGWTVAAHLCALGDNTMLEDYKYGIKPAKVLCYLLRHGAGSLSGRSRGDIKQLTAEVQKDSWDYFACKIGQHGTSYLMGPDQLSNKIFTESEGKLSLSRQECRDLQRLFTIRYRVAIWHEATRIRLSRQPYPPRLVSASGHVRIFFGRYTEILGEALANEPQENTTYATNLAMYHLWTDKDNYVDGHHKIPPLHQVHDALVGQFRQEDTPWAVGKIKQWFNNPIKIAGIPLVIPFEGAYGPSWGELNAGTI